MRSQNNRDQIRNRFYCGSARTARKFTAVLADELMFQCSPNVMLVSEILPVILRLQELELLLDPVAGLGDSELERLSRLMRDLNPKQTACEGRKEELSHQSSASRHTHRQDCS